MAFSTPLICCSSGVITVSAMVFGEAPGYWPLTTTVGGTISGYSLMGSDGIDNSPATVMIIASTEAKIGRSMKNEEMFMALRRALGRRVHRYPLRCDGYAGMHALRAVHDDDIARLQALTHDAQAVDHSSERDLTILDLVVGSDKLHAGEEARREQAVLVVEDGACPDGAGLRIELIIDEVHRSRVREARLVGETDVHRIRRI